MAMNKQGEVTRIMANVAIPMNVSAPGEDHDNDGDEYEEPGFEPIK